MSFSEAWNLGFPPMMWVLAVVSAVITLIGFYKFVYFISVGYGLSVSGIGITLLIMYADMITLASLLQCVLLILYGFRLSGFLLYREFRSNSYRHSLEKSKTAEKPMPIFAKITIWICVVALYIAQTSPAYYRLVNNSRDDIMIWIGVIVMAIALTIETLADLQKNTAKKANPNRFCDTGLYKIVRCPNYLGEILFWTGVLLTGFGALTGAVQCVVAALGYILILYVMFSGAKQLETRQNKSYGNQKDYQSYVKKTPILLPFIPLYSLKNWDFIK